MKPASISLKSLVEELLQAYKAGARDIALLEQDVKQAIKCSGTHDPTGLVLSGLCAGVRLDVRFGIR